MNQQPPQIITIDDVQYDLNALPPQIKGTLSLIETARQRTQNSQIELAMNQAAHNHFVTELRAQLQQMRQEHSQQLAAQRKVAKATQVRRPANQNSNRGKKR